MLGCLWLLLYGLVFVLLSRLLSVWLLLELAC